MQIKTIARNHLDREIDMLTHARLSVTPQTVAHQAPLFVGFSRQEYWNGLPCPPPRDLPNPGIEPTSLTAPALAGGFFTTSTTWEAPCRLYIGDIQFLKVV